MGQHRGHENDERLTYVHTRRERQKVMSFSYGLVLFFSKRQHDRRSEITGLFQMDEAAVSPLLISLSSYQI